MIIQAIAGVGAGAICDRYGPRALTAIACLATALGYILLSQMHSLREFYLGMLFLVAIGTVTSYVVAVAIIPRWFIQKRGLALGLALAGMGIGDMVFPRLMTYIITRHGWRMAYLVLAGVVAAVALLCAALLRSMPQQVQSALQETDRGTVTKEPVFSLRQCMKLSQFWGFFAIWTLVGIPLMIIRTHIVSDATDIGMSEAAAAFVLTSMGATATVSRIGIGRISDLLGDKYTYFACLVLQLVALFVLMAGRSPWIFYFSAAIFGMGTAGAAIVYPKIVVDLFGIDSLGTLIGILGIGWYIGAALAPSLSGWIFDQTESYFWAYAMGGLMMGLALILAMVVLRGYSRPPITESSLLKAERFSGKKHYE
jgi:MFS family permease